MRRPASLNLALIGNCAIGALVDADARIVWCCLPRFDGDPVFHALLDSPAGCGDEGSYGVEIEHHVRSEQAYDEGTAILRTRLFAASGDAVEVCDFAPRFFSRGRAFRPAMLVRRVRPLRGHPRIRIALQPRFDAGRVEPEVARGSHHLRFHGPQSTLRLTTDAPITYVQQGTWFSLAEPISLILGPDETLERGVPEVAREFEERTALYWRGWPRALSVPLEWQDAVLRAALTLKLCLYEESGAIVAAMTTSIPEAPGSGRNWDYRYCWLRDAFFVVRALNSLSEVGTMEEYLRWLHDVVRDADGGHIQPLYGIGLEKALPERELTHLRGYRGMGPVRFGNQAHEHFQHDVYGHVVLGAAQSFHCLLYTSDAADD